jgi:hypothetical protein
MPGKNRHRKPTTVMLFNRLYRQQLQLAQNQIEMRADIDRLLKRTEILVVLTDHCQRLVREKETLLKLVQANRYMAEAIPRIDNINKEMSSV